jgi:hypothetical protein
MNYLLPTGAFPSNHTKPHTHKEMIVKEEDDDKNPESFAHRITELPLLLRQPSCPQNFVVDLFLLSLKSAMTCVVYNVIQHGGGGKRDSPLFQVDSSFFCDA